MGCAEKKNLAHNTATRCSPLRTMSHQALVVIAAKDYQDLELDGTLKGLKNHGFEPVLASSTSGECKGQLGGSQQVNLALKDVNVRDYDRVAFIGGSGAKALSDDAQAQRVAREFFQDGKVVGAICHGPLVLAKAGVLQDQKSTVYTPEDASTVKTLEKHGARYVGDKLVVCGRIVTAMDPTAADEFGEKLATLRGAA